MALHRERDDRYLHFESAGAEMLVRVDFNFRYSMFAAPHAAGVGTGTKKPKACASAVGAGLTEMAGG
jgi:hypothetical protein